jgi:hypothetical protein
MATQNENQASVSKPAQPASSPHDKPEKPPFMWVVVALLVIVAAYFVAR